MKNGKDLKELSTEFEIQKAYDRVFLEHGVDQIQLTLAYKKYDLENNELYQRRMGQAKAYFAEGRYKLMRKDIDYDDNYDWVTKLSRVFLDVFIILQPSGHKVGYYKSFQS